MIDRQTNIGKKYRQSETNKNTVDKQKDTSTNKNTYVDGKQAKGKQTGLRTQLTICQKPLAGTRVTFVPPTSITLHTLYGALKSHYQADENACIQEHGIIFQSMDQVKKCDGHQLLNEHGDHH